MARFNLMHCLPDPRMHGLNGYREVIDTVAWGLRELGHEVGITLNKAESSATNIVFGAQVLPVDTLRALPKGSIVYNFEQMRGLTPAQMRPEVRFIAQHFGVWEYSRDQLPSWSSLGKFDAKAVPVGYAPILQRIAAADRQDIDVLLYGLSGKGRAEAFHRISQAGLCTVFVSGLYGAARDELIARSKIVLNVNLYERSKIFEIVRVSYLLANRKAVVAVADAQTAVEDDIRPGVRFTRPEKLPVSCLELVADDGARRALEEAGFEAMSRRDIRTILAAALG